MKYDNFSDLFMHICEIKQFVLKLSMKELKIYKQIFYSQKIENWMLNVMWEFIWEDKDYKDMKLIFENANVIKGAKK